MDLFGDQTPMSAYPIVGLGRVSLAAWFEYLAFCDPSRAALLMAAARRPASGLFAQAGRRLEAALCADDDAGVFDIIDVVDASIIPDWAARLFQRYPQAVVISADPATVPPHLYEREARAPQAWAMDQDAVVVLDAAQCLPVSLAVALALHVRGLIVVRRGADVDGASVVSEDHEAGAIERCGGLRLSRNLRCTTGSAWTFAKALLKGMAPGSAPVMLRVPSAPAIDALRLALLGSAHSLLPDGRGVLEFVPVPGAAATPAGETGNSLQRDAEVQAIGEYLHDAPATLVSPYRAQVDLMRAALPMRTSLTLAQARQCDGTMCLSLVADPVVTPATPADFDARVLAHALTRVRKLVVFGDPQWLQRGAGDPDSPTSVLSRFLRLCGRRSIERNAVIVDDAQRRDALAEALGPEWQVTLLLPQLYLPGHRVEDAAVFNLRQWLSPGPRHYDRLVIATAADRMGEAAAWWVLRRLRTLGINVPDQSLCRLRLPQKISIPEEVDAIRRATPCPLDLSAARAGLCQMQLLDEFTQGEASPLAPLRWAILRSLAHQKHPVTARHMRVGIELESGEWLMLRDGERADDPEWLGDEQQADALMTRLWQIPPPRLHLCREAAEA